MALVKSSFSVRGWVLRKGISVNETTIDVRAARRLVLARAGLLRPQWTGLPAHCAARGRWASRCCHAVIGRFGYLQLDTVAIAGARTQGLVLAARLPGLDARHVETLLQPGEPLFEYWGHEASWLPMALYPYFGFRRRAFRVHPWWGDLLVEQRRLAARLLDRIRVVGPLRSLDLEGESAAGWWNIKLAKRVAEALWSAGDLAIAARVNFQRVYDLPERVIPGDVLAEEVTDGQAYAALLLKALEGHGWATTSTMAATWRLRHCRAEIEAALAQLKEAGAIIPCRLTGACKDVSGWIRPADLELAQRLAGMRLRRDKAVFLSPFDPVLWDRARAALLFGFEHLLEIYKPAARRRYGYYVLPALAGDEFIGRVDLKAFRDDGYIEIRAEHFERDTPTARERAAMASAYQRHGSAVGIDRFRP